MTELGDVIIALEDKGFDDNYLAMAPQLCREPLQDIRIQSRLMRIANLAGFGGNADAILTIPRPAGFSGSW